ncbi:MAG: hypothetical protein ACKO3W_05675 [bacterium]
MADPRDNAGRKPSLMRNLEGFFRGIADGLEEDGAEQNPPQEVPAGTSADTDAGGFRRGEVREVGRRVQEARRGDFLLRRTTIDEVIHSPEVQNPET